MTRFSQGLLLAMLAMSALGVAQPSQAVVNCNVSATPLAGTYSADSPLTMDGQFTVTCSRSAGDAQVQALYLGINQTATGREMQREGGADRLPYGIYRARPTTGQWTESTGRAENDLSPGGLLFTLDFLSAGSLAAQRVVPFHLTVPAGLNRYVGSYADAGISASLRLDGAAGQFLSSILFTARASIRDQCSVAPPPAPLVLQYMAFMNTTAQAAASFNVTCTIGTSYAIALDPAAATMDAVEISYQLRLDAASGQGSSQAQPYRITGTAAAGQPGRCATTACSASRTHSIVVSY